MDLDLRGVVVGFVAAAVVLSVLLWVVGIDHVVDAFAMLDGRYVLLIAAGGLCWLAAWGMALRTVLGALDIDVSPGTSFLLYASAAFANNVTPFGQAGGEPFSALLISRATDAEYERGLAAIASVDTLNFVPSVVLALFGLGYYLTVVAVGDQLLVVLAFVVGLAVAVPTAGYLLWSWRSRLKRTLVSALAPALRVVGRVVPWLSPPTDEEIRRRVTSFFQAIERVADSRRDLAVALAFSALGWLCMVSTLWLSLLALNAPVPFAAALITVPVASVASVTPLPGGLGGVEFAIVLLIAPIGGMPAATAASAALVYRGATYWLSTVVGGGAAAWLEGNAEG